MAAARRMAVLKLDLSPVLPSASPWQHSGKGKSLPALRGNVNCGENSHQAVGRQERIRHIISAYFNRFLCCPYISFFAVLFLHPLSGLVGTKPARVLLPSSPHLLLHLLLSPPAHKRWRLMNSAPMHASANCIGIGNSSQYYKMFSPSRWPPGHQLNDRL